MAVPEELEEDDEESPLEEFIVKPLLVFEELELEELFYWQQSAPKWHPRGQRPKRNPAPTKRKAKVRVYGTTASFESRG